MEKIIHNGRHFVPKGLTIAEETFVSLQLIERTCSRCGEKWLSIYMNDMVVMGGTTNAGDGNFCLDCSMKEILK